MTPEQTDLAHRVALLPGLRLAYNDWRAMLVSVESYGDGWELVHVVNLSYPPHLECFNIAPEGKWGGMDLRKDGATFRPCPDLTDPATGGCLLALLGSGWSSTTPTAGHHVVVKRDIHGPRGEGRTLAEACARVALSLGRWPGGVKP